VQPVGPDQHLAAVGQPVLAGDGDVAGGLLDHGHVPAGLQDHARFLATGAQEQVQQVLPVHDDVGGAVAAADPGQVEGGEPPAGQGMHGDQPAGLDGRLEQVVEQAVPAQQPGGVRGELQAGADLGERLGPLERGHPQPAATEQQNPRGYRIEAVDRALVLIRLLDERGSVSVGEVAAELDVAPSSVHRLLATLCHRGFAVQDRHRRYRPGPELRASAPALPSLPALLRVARPFLHGLFERAGESVHLVVLAGPDVRFVDGIEGEQPLRVGLRTGARMPAYCTSGGRPCWPTWTGARSRRCTPTGCGPGRTPGSVTCRRCAARPPRFAGRGTASTPRRANRA